MWLEIKGPWYEFQQVRAWMRVAGRCKCGIKCWVHIYLSITSVLEETDKGKLPLNSTWCSHPFYLGVMGWMVSQKSCVHVLIHRTMNMTLFFLKKGLRRCNEVEDLKVRSSGLSRGRWVSNPITNVFRDRRGGDTEDEAMWRGRQRWKTMQPQAQGGKEPPKVGRGEKGSSSRNFKGGVAPWWWTLASRNGRG